MLTVLVLALLLFGIRLKFRLFYGLTEIAFACWVAWDKLPDIDITTFVSSGYGATQASTLTIGLLSGSIYLAVRGLDNMHQGWKNKEVEALKANVPDRFWSAEKRSEMEARKLK